MVLFSAPSWRRTRWTSPSLKSMTRSHNTNSPSPPTPRGGKEVRGIKRQGLRHPAPFCDRREGDSPVSVLRRVLRRWRVFRFDQNLSQDSERRRTGQSRTEKAGTRTATSRYVYRGPKKAGTRTRRTNVPLNYGTPRTLESSTKASPARPLIRLTCISAPYIHSIST